MQESELYFEDNEEKEYLQEIEGILNKIMHALHTHPELMQTYFPLGFTISYFMTAAGSHVFDDNPGDFNITKMEGHTLRGWTQSDHVKKDSKTEWHDDAGLLKKLKL